MQNGNESIDSVAVTSAIIALLSAGFAFWQAKIAKEAYRLQNTMC